MELIRLSNNGFNVLNIFDESLLSELASISHTFKTESERTGDTGLGKREVLSLKMDIRREIDSQLKLIDSVIPSYFVGSYEMWRDYSGYINQWHYDNPMYVQNIVLVYLEDGPAKMGTQYKEDGEIYTVSAKKNTALILLNSDKIEHGMMTNVPEGIIRRTIYGNWRYRDKTR